MAIRILGIGRDAKTVKGEKFGIMTGINYMAPYRLSGRNVCPMASDGCIAACLNTAGNGRYDNVQASRIAKTNYYFRDRAVFMAQLVAEIRALVRKAGKAGMVPAVRLNGTSDILWERVPVVVEGVTFPNVMAAFPDVEFYDYTKHNPDKRATLPANYRLTFSLDERPESEARAMRALALRWNVSAVFRKALPETFLGRKVINGDESDVRFADESGVIVGLTAKGKARGDRTGFVRD